MNVAQNLAKLFSLERKVVLLTGAAGGIGSVLATGMAQAGAHVALCDVDKSAMEKLCEELSNSGAKASVHVLDVQDSANITTCVEEIVAQCGHIDVLVNCAGINRREGIMDVQESTYDRIMNINLKGAFMLTQAVGKHMIVAKSGSIINIGSHNTGWVLGGCGVYAATKSALVALTKAQAVELAKHNIRSNCISPGHIQTPLTVPTWENPEKSRYLLEHIAMNRPGYPQDIVGVCILLASDASSYITGCEYRVDGGCIAGGQPWPYDTNY